MKYKIITTDDGSKTIYLPEIDEQYHSHFGAVTESRHIFIHNALERRMSETHSESINVLEIGFGTGLNALLTLMYRRSTPSSPRIIYYTYELFPLEHEVIRTLFENVLSPEEWEWMQLLHDAEWGQKVEIDEGFTIIKINADLITSELPRGMDVIYMDAFAPEKTPEFWTPTFLGSLRQASASGAWLATYCAKGIVRRTLRDVGFDVFRLPGPPGGKREILAARAY